MTMTEEAVKPTLEEWEIRTKIHEQLKSAVDASFCITNYVKDGPTFVDALQDKLDDLRKEITPAKGSELLAKNIDAIAEYVAHAPPIQAIGTGVENFDLMFGGWVEGRLYILAAYVAQYKTRGGLSLAKALAKAGYAVLIISLEMNAEEVTRIILRSGETGLPIWISSEIRNLRDIEKEIKAFQANVSDTSPFMVLIDYLQLVEGDGKDFSREREVNRVAQSLSRIARETGCIMLALAQISRAGANSGAMPELWHLRESGGIEQAADLVLVWVLEGNKLRCKSLKNRWGSKDIETTLVCDFEKLTLTSYTKEDEQDDFLNQLQASLEQTIIEDGPATTRDLSSGLKLYGRHPKKYELSVAISRSHLVRLGDDGKTVEPIQNGRAK